jgi:acetyl-CoA decarbonylase/synthase complex subunit delta
MQKEVTLGFEIFKETYSGRIREISIGKGDNAVTLGGESCYPFYRFEGDIPHKPKIAMEIWDIAPEDWPEAAIAPFRDVAADPAAWAKKCVEEFGAQIIVLQLKSVDPNGLDASPESAAETVKKVLAAVSVPLIVWGCANPQKDEAVLKKISEACQGTNLTLGPVEDKNHKGIGASAMGYGHALISSSPIDVNLAKQVNILLENLGMPMERMLIDPTTGGLGYGLEYTYSVMERLRMAALAQGDGKLQLPIVNNLGNEIWKCKEAKLSAQEAPELGDPEKRAILMEAVAAVTYLMAGSDILIMRHPEAVRMVRSFIDLAAEGGTAADVAAIRKALPEVEIDLSAIAPAPNLAIEAEKKAPEKKAAPPKAEKPAAAATAAPVVEKKPEPAPEAKPAPVPEPQVIDFKAAEAKAKAEAESKAKMEAEAKAKAEAEAKARAEADRKAKEAAEAKAKTEADAKAQAEARAKKVADEEAIRGSRAKEREERAARMKEIPGGAAAMTPAAEQRNQIEKMLDRLNRIHRRVA